MSADTAADLHAEIRRLRIRLAGLGPADLDRPAAASGAEPAAAGSGPPAASGEPSNVRAAVRDAAAPAPVPGGSPPTRREAIRAALSELSALRADGRPVPDLGDRVLGDQLVVLLSDCLPAYGATEAECARAVRIAAGLRRALA
ncbi:hypothetical protein GSY69_11860 [Brevibacterium sp. 5221]|uniref:Uncharacterized protein n=1 Tax=Brevibacterium rongguiense TaxID=2695267 RepID=A0A6N9HA47_9MICO|nr:hypothetical protein [Brevibacterium rongguiense]MYM20636.1 hypothetical protein [Brevibacterium rongguiense]